METEDDDVTEQLSRTDGNLVTEKNSGDGTIPMGGNYVTMTSVGTKIEPGPSIKVDSYGKVIPGEERYGRPPVPPTMASAPYVIPPKEGLVVSVLPDAKEEDEGARVDSSVGSDSGSKDSDSGSEVGADEEVHRARYRVIPDRSLFKEN